MIQDVVYSYKGKRKSVFTKVFRDGTVYKLFNDEWREVQHYKGRPKFLIVLELFVGPKPTPEHEGCHKDDDRSNNHADNLYWGTHKQNMEDASRNGKVKCPRQIRTEALVEKAVELYQSGRSVEEVAKELDIAYGAAYAWITRKIKTRPNDGGRPKKITIKDDKVRTAIRKMYETGLYSRKEVAAKFGFTERVIYKVTSDIHFCRNMKGR